MRNTSITYEQLLKDAKRWRRQNPHLNLQQAQDEVAKKAGYATLYEAYQVLSKKISSKKGQRASLIERLKLQCGEDFDLYYYCRSLMELQVEIPPQVDWPTIQPLIEQQPTLWVNGYRRYDLKAFDRIIRELEFMVEDEELDTDDSGTLIGDDYTGIVSFRSECQADIDALREQLKKANLLDAVGDDSRTIGDLKLREKSGETSEIPDCRAEWTIRNPLTVRRLFDAMSAVVDGHVMFETLRALPLSQNSLDRRYDDAPPENWASNERL